MIDYKDADSQGIGGTGRPPVQARDRRRLTLINCADDNQAEVAFNREALSRGPQSATLDPDDLFLSESLFGLHQQGVKAATAAYDNILQTGMSEDQACRGALLAFQAVCPDDENASDAVVDAILAANKKWGEMA